MKYIFYTNGKAWCKGNETITEDHIVAEHPDDIALWRISIDPKTKEITVLYPGSKDSEAEKLHAEEFEKRDLAAKESIKQEIASAISQ